MVFFYSFTLLLIFFGVILGPTVGYSQTRQQILFVFGLYQRTNYIKKSMKYACGISNFFSKLCKYGVGQFLSVNLLMGMSKIPEILILVQ